MIEQDSAAMNRNDGRRVSKKFSGLIELELFLCGNNGAKMFIRLTPEEIEGRRTMRVNVRQGEYRGEQDIQKLNIEEPCPCNLLEAFIPSLL